MAQKSSSAKGQAASTASEPPSATMDGGQVIPAQAEMPVLAQPAMSSASEPFDVEPMFPFTLLKPARIAGRKRSRGETVMLDREQLLALDAQRVIDIRE